MRTTKLKPSDMDSLLASKHTSKEKDIVLAKHSLFPKHRLLASADKYRRINNYEGDGMYTDNIRFMPQRRDLDKIEYMYNEEFYDVMKELEKKGFEIKLEHSENDYDLYDITITNTLDRRYRDMSATFYNCEDVDDLLAEIHKAMYHANSIPQSRFIKNIKDKINKIMVKYEN